ncbi:hypothetical protein GGH94_005612 [Coemansia aciculifera]|uniref:TPR-like protein n=1 Tax=Coemansia aciculifera TaxID=417176 RepID=A0A9W8IFT4_9FUNG|nr:hypothetical protein GGH94_005612 [Coemansia aciculifera]
MQRSVFALSRQLLSTRHARWYSDGKLFKGVPKFTRVQPKGSRQVVPIGVSDSSEHPDVDTGSRIELNAKNLGRLALIGGAAITCVGLIGVATYYVTTYFYLKNHWPVPADVENGAARNLLYKATYYEQLSPNKDRALSALEKALELLVVRGGASPDCVTVVDIKVRIAACLSGLGQREEAIKLLYQVLPTLEALSSRKNEGLSNGDNSAADLSASPGVHIASAESVLLRLAMVLGQACAASDRVDEAKRAFTIGLQTVKQMKRNIVRGFDSEDITKYTAYDDLNQEEAELTAQLAKVFYNTGDSQVASTLFKGVINAVKQHRAQLDLAPRIVGDMRTFKDGWLCLDALAMLYLAKIELDSGNTSAALPWIESARTIANDMPIQKQTPRCVDCEASLLAQLGRVAESQGNNKRALLRYREASEYARIYFSDLHSELQANVKRFESEQGTA